MKEAFIGKGFSNEYICFTRWKWRGSVAEVHSEANKYNVTKYVKQCIANWIGERVEKIKEKNLSDEEFGQLIGNDFNKLTEELEKLESSKPSSLTGLKKKPHIYIEDAQPLTKEGIKKICQNHESAESTSSDEGGKDA